MADWPTIVCAILETKQPAIIYTKQPAFDDAFGSSKWSTFGFTIACPIRTALVYPVIET